MPDPFRQQENNTSSIFQKLTPELRRAVDIAIIERCPPTFQGIWMQLKLGEHGVTYSSFYRYARRLRDRANLSEIAALADDKPGDLDEPIRKLISRRLLEVLLHTDDAASIKEVASLLTAHRQAARLALHQNRQEDQSLLAWARVETERDRVAATLAEPSRRKLPEPDRDEVARRVGKLLEQVDSDDSPKADPAAKPRPDPESTPRPLEFSDT